MAKTKTKQPDVVAQLRAQGVDPELIAEVERGYMREAAFTQKAQQLAAAREQLAYQLGQQGAGGNGAPKSKLETVLASLGDDENARGAAEFLRPLFQALQEDLQASTDQRVQPLLSHVQSSTRSQALDRRLETELLPQFGPGIKEHWGDLKEEMLGALDRGELVDPIGFTYRSLGADAHQLAQQHLEQQHKTQTDGTGEGFSHVKQSAPAFTGASGGQGQTLQSGGLSNGSGGTGGKPAPPPTLADQASEYLKIMSDVQSGNVRG